MEAMANWLFSEAGMAAALGALALGVAALTKASAVKKYRLERALQCLEAGVRVVYEEYVRARKRAAGDGKLTDAQRAEANRLALAAARDFARAEGVDLAKTYAREYLPVLVDRLVQRRKDDAGDSASASSLWEVAARAAAAVVPFALDRLAPPPSDAAPVAAATPTASAAAVLATAAGRGARGWGGSSSASVRPGGADAGAEDDPLARALAAADGLTRDPFGSAFSPGSPVV